MHLINKNFLIRTVQDKKIDISIFHCVICSQLLLSCFIEVVSMNAFLGDQINIFCCKRLKCHFFAQIIFTFYVHLLPVTNKCFTHIWPLIHTGMPQILMLKPRPMNLYVKVNSHVHQDLQKSFQFSRYPKLKIQ